jgi:RNA polymerase sigma-70 factor (ECF subfamily)
LEELLTRYLSLIYQVVRRQTANAEEANDLVQETMLRVFVSIGKVRREASFTSWLIAIAINASISTLSNTRPTPEQECLRKELRELLKREIHKLRPKYRFILRARDLDESSIEDIARSLDITQRAPKSRLYRARQMLSSAFEDMQSRA